MFQRTNDVTSNTLKYNNYPTTENNKSFNIYTNHLTSIP